MKRLLMVVSITVLFLQQTFSQNLPPVYLNHLYLVLDTQTYRAIKSSSFLCGEFSDFEERTSISNNGKSWTGVYFYGKQTYIEFFSDGAFPQFKTSETGIGFGVEETGAVQIYYNRLKEKFGEQADHGLVTKKINDKNVPWFYDAGVTYNDDKQTFYDWLMEYEKDYLKIFYPDLKPEEDGITRKQNLSRNFKRERLFENIREATIALNETERERFIKELEAFDYQITKKKGEIIAIGPSIKFLIIEDNSANGITNLKIELTRKMHRQHIFRFGAKSVLKIRGKTAVWTF